jgi:hypothetical protein
LDLRHETLAGFVRGGLLAGQRLDLQPNFNLIQIISADETVAINNVCTIAMAGIVMRPISD